MALFHDFSDISEANYKYSKYLILRNQYLIEREGEKIRLITEYEEKAKQELKEEYPFRDFWINLSLGIEILTKAVLIRHEIDIFSKKNREEFKKGIKVVSKSNEWLQQILESKEIEFVSQINTGTLGNLYKNKIDLLSKKGVINSEDKDSVEEGLQMLAQQRRNNDLHFYFKQNNFIKQKDIPEVYVPLINTLIETYRN